MDLSLTIRFKCPLHPYYSFHQLLNVVFKWCIWFQINFMLVLFIYYYILNFILIFSVAF